MADSNFQQSFDARAWARAFLEQVQVCPALATDEGAMIGWFANALMRGFDEHASRMDSAARVRVAFVRAYDVLLELARSGAQTPSIQLFRDGSGLVHAEPWHDGKPISCDALMQHDAPVS